MLHAPEFPIGAERAFGGVHLDKSQFSREFQQRNVTKIAGQFRVLGSVAENQILHDELNINNAATIMLDVEQSARIRVDVENFLPHRQDLILQYRQFSPLAKNFLANA